MGVSQEKEEGESTNSKLTFTRAHSSLKQLEIGMPFQIRLFPLLKVQRMVWLGLHLW